MFKSVFISFAFTIIATTGAVAATCTPYEREAFALWDEGQAFKYSRTLKEFGWSGAGPHNGWLKRWQALNADDEKSSDFSGKHGVSQTIIYEVIDEYRTAGKLDSFYQELEDEFNAIEPCK